MPWNVSKSDRCPTDKPWAVIKEGGEIEGCHSSEADAEKQQRALYQSEQATDTLQDFGEVIAYRRKRSTER